MKAALGRSDVEEQLNGGEAKSRDSLSGAELMLLLHSFIAPFH